MTQHGIGKDKVHGILLLNLLVSHLNLQIKTERTTVLTPMFLVVWNTSLFYNKRLKHLCPKLHSNKA